ncbi:MAG: acyl carrier protein [Candidatus Omnitrophota bacterium]|nr:MAG: acyl carrier protein [Candidatus Omnitrophota bacterium]
MEIKENIIGLICKVLDVQAQEVKLDETLYDTLGVDSTEMVELRVAINKNLGINLEQSEVTNRQTPNQIIEVVEKKKQ